MERSRGSTFPKGGGLQSAAGQLPLALPSPGHTVRDGPAPSSSPGCDLRWGGRATRTEKQLTERKSISSRRRRGPGHRWSRCSRPTHRALAEQPHPPSRRGPSVRPRPPGSPAPELWAWEDPLSAAPAQQTPPTRPAAAAVTRAVCPSPEEMDRRRQKRRAGKVDRRRALG